LPRDLADPANLSVSQSSPFHCCARFCIRRLLGIGNFLVAFGIDVLIAKMD
jgi:hypothetical protein